MIIFIYPDYEGLIDDGCFDRRRIHVYTRKLPFDRFHEIYCKFSVSL